MTSTTRTTRTTGTTRRGGRIRGRTWLALPTTLALVLAGCGDGQDGAAPPAEDTAATSAPDPVASTDAPAETGAGTSSPDPAPETGDTGATEDPEPTDTAAAPDAEAPTYPDESIAYAREFLTAWSSLDDDRIAQLAVEEVTHGTDSWAVWETQGEATSCPLDPLSLPDQGVDLDGLDLVDLSSPESNPVSIVIRRDALGGERAVVGVDLRLTEDVAAALGRPETPLDAYARSFVEAWAAEDLETMSRLGDEDIAAEAVEHRPLDASQAPVWSGFLALEGDPVTLLVQAPPSDEEVHDFTVTIDLDPALAVAGEPHAVVDQNVIVDPRYFCADQDSIVEDPAPTG